MIFLYVRLIYVRNNCAGGLQMNNVFMALQLILTVVLIVSVLLQETKASAGSSAIMGGSSQTTAYFKPKGKEAVFSKITKISAILYFINAIVLVAIQ
jgi:preprotein translocase subunit SecG